MSVDLTRQELYDLVWSKPMMHAAKQFGISGDPLLKKLPTLKTLYFPESRSSSCLYARPLITRAMLPSGKVSDPLHLCRIHSHSLRFS